MQSFVTFLTVVGGLILSIAVAIGVEEFIFGRIFATFFGRPKPSLEPPVFANWTVEPVRVREAGPR